MSKKDYRKKWKFGFRWENNGLYYVGNYLYRYFKKRTTKGKYENEAHFRDKATKYKNEEI